MSARSRPVTVAGIATPLVAVLAVLVFAVLEGDVPEAAGDLVRPVAAMLHHFGHLAPFGLLYAEESGVPMPVPGDVFVMYAGRHLVRGAATWALVFGVFIAVVVLGASNLYLVARRVGKRLPEYRVGRLLHVTPARIATAERWFDRWGMLALIFGRHIPGFRVPLTIAAGIVRFPYRTFALSVAISTGIWVSVFLTLGAVFGGRVERLLRIHRELYWLMPIAALFFVALFLWQGRGTHRTVAPAARTEPP